MKKRQNINFAPVYYLGLWLALFALLESCRVQQLPPPENATARNIIFLIGDGMGLGHISAALYANDNSLNLEQFTHIGFQKTYSANDLITDSAAGATAFACGVKTYNGAIGLTADSAACETILEELQGQGYATGLVATATIVHATSAAFAAHQPIRVFYEEIAEDLAASGVDYLVGGGKRYFDRREKDERDLIREMEGNSYYVTSYLEHELKDLVPSPMSRFCYFAADKHPLTKAAGRDYLPRAVSMGASFLGRRSNTGFFLMAEGSMIDWGGHSNDGGLVIEETKDFDRAVKEALNFARRDRETLVIVTADHESGGMALNPGSSFESINASFTTNGHTAAMVPVFAYGPGAELFDGIYENTEIYYKMRQALGLPQKTVVEGK
ncbi:MAG: alkaline phosphatase [Phaeodactylibacter xiamenensis]|uniref:Alkaline phosphatase n=1 Tax=Phaeodactylibacter xiamenensis TaxID=1524460 RepID=A0A098S1X8_9BACT|nr:alkaline phosphatase [Phaeodactylibacter xiamenensis]KGE86329.1 hypothetical protein IX84_21230 [Phaeodactylibacter xiamenensis]